MSPPSPSNRRPRILQVVSYLTLGGAERVALTITRALRDEFDFSLHAVRGSERQSLGDPIARELQALGIPFSLGTNLPMRFGGMLTSGFELARVVRRVQPDLIHLHTEIPEAAYAVMAFCSPRLRAIPVVRTVHNTVFWDFFRPFARWCDRRMATAHVVGVSAGCVQTFQRLRSESGAPPPGAAPVKIYNGCPQPASLPPRRKRTESQPVEIVFGGRFELQKGTDLLPEILKRVRPPASGAHLVLYGCGTHEPLLRQLAQTPPPGWTIEVHPPIPDFAEQLSRFDLVLMPSRYEGLGLVAVEAAMVGVPVVATNTEGLRDVFPSDYPWLAQPGDAASFAAKLQDALDQPTQWNALGEQMQNRARTMFAVDAMADGYRKTYLQALQPAA